MTAERQETLADVLARYEAAEGADEKLELAKEAVRQLAEYNPWEVRLRALHYAQRKRAEAELSAFLWSIPLALVMTAVFVALVRWLP